MLIDEMYKTKCVADPFFPSIKPRRLDLLVPLFNTGIGPQQRKTKVHQPLHSSFSLFPAAAQVSRCLRLSCFAHRTQTDAFPN